VISAALLVPFALGLSLQSSDPKAVAEDLTRKFLDQERFHLEYSVRMEGTSPDRPPLATIEVSVDFPRRLCRMRLRVNRQSDEGPAEQNLTLNQFVLRSWGSDQDPIQMDLEAGTKEYRESHKELIQALLHLNPAADTSSLDLLPWVPSVQLGLSPASPPQNNGELTVRCGPALCGEAASWLNAVRYLEKADLKRTGDFCDFGFPDGRRIRVERQTGFLYSAQARNADGSRLVLSLDRRQVGVPSPAFEQPATFTKTDPPPDWDRRIGTWHTQILERLIAILSATPNRLVGESGSAEFQSAVSRAAALCADCLERSFLRQNARDQVTALLRKGLAPSELRDDAPGLIAGYVRNYQTGREAFLGNIWKSLDETVFLEIRTRIQETAKASGTPFEFAVLQALDREALAPFQKRPTSEWVAEIFREELNRTSDR
jgi:hypothetical protein